MKRAERPAELKEKVRHGTDLFPCAFYAADYREVLPGEPFRVDVHWHGETELIHFEEGEYELLCGTERLSVTEETFCFLGPGIIHGIRGTGKYIEQAVVLDPGMLCSNYNDAAELEYLRPLSRGELVLPLFITAKDAPFAEIRTAFAEIRKAFGGTRPGTKIQALSDNGAAVMRIKAAFLRIIAVLVEERQVVRASQRPDERSESLKEVVSYIRTHFAEAIYIRDLASIMNMNEQYFCRFFKKTMDITPIAYINEIRLTEASRRLYETDASVSEIAYACGFGNLGHFTTTFRKMYGTTPRAFRKELRDAAEGAADGSGDV